jgi:nucleoid-associated protein YgaU
VTAAGLPPERLVTILAGARQRGRPFDEAWRGALAEAVEGRRDAQPWRDALADTRAAWERAFDRVAPTKPEQAVSLVADAIGLIGA